MRLDSSVRQRIVVAPSTGDPAKDIRCSGPLAFDAAQSPLSRPGVTRKRIGRRQCVVVRIRAYFLRTRLSHGRRPGCLATVVRGG